MKKSEDLSGTKTRLEIAEARDYFELMDVYSLH
jgi:hypothetical protein